MNSSKTQARFRNVNSWAKAYFYIRWRAVDETKEKSTLKSEWDKIVNKTDNKLFDVMANFIWTDSSIKMDIQFLKWENTKDKQVLKFLLQSQLLVGETEQKR